MIDSDLARATIYMALAVFGVVLADLWRIAAARLFKRPLFDETALKQAVKVARDSEYDVRMARVEDSVRDAHQEIGAVKGEQRKINHDLAHLDTKRRSE